MTLKYIIYREDKYYVAQCLNVDVSTFGESIKEAQNSLKEALEHIQIDEVLLGETIINV